jgi:FkbM family methyltransferase
MIEFLGGDPHDSMYGGWNTELEGLGKDSIVYAFGVGREASWDLALIKRFGCDIHAFDMTPEIKGWVEKADMPPQFHFHPYGLADFDGEASFNLLKKPSWEFTEASMHIYPTGNTVKLPVKRLSTIMRELGHSHIDVLKIDIEGEEYNVLRDIGNIPVKQLLVEFHIKSRRLKLKWYVARLRLWLRGYKRVALQNTDYTYVR